MSPRAACRLESLGFTQVYDYVTGLTDWTANGLSTEGPLADIPAARDAVRRETPTCLPTERLGDVRERVRAADRQVCIVTSEDGIVLGRLRRDALDAGSEALVESVMEEGPTTVRPDELLEGLTERMRDRGVATMLVTTSTGKLIGVLYRKDAEETLHHRSGHTP